MGKALADAYPSAKAVFDEADEVLGFPISKLCFEGPDDQLRLTENTQPALLTVSVACWRVLEEHGYRPAYVAGHSLGEYSALVAAGALEFRDAVRLVRLRGRYMQEAVPAGVGAMAAMLKLAPEKLGGILQQAAGDEIVSAANFNSPDQIVIAGHVGAVQRAMELAKTAGVKRVIQLPVSAPFHCPLMEPAQKRLQADLDATSFSDLRVPLMNNWQAKLIHTAEEARVGLFHQVPSSVLWLDSMRGLFALGVERFVEVGVGAVLCGLLRNIDPARRSAKFGEPADLEKVRELLA
jgi:[acyl-carrier-protein] S-malonyltransferase